MTKQKDPHSCLSRWQITEKYASYLQNVDKVTWLKLLHFWGFKCSTTTIATKHTCKYIWKIIIKRNTYRHCKQKLYLLNYTIRVRLTKNSVNTITRLHYLLVDWGNRNMIALIMGRRCHCPIRVNTLLKRTEEHLHL